MPLDFMFLIFRIDKFSGGRKCARGQRVPCHLKTQPLSDYTNDPQGGRANILPEFYFGVPVKSDRRLPDQRRPGRFPPPVADRGPLQHTPPLTPEEQALSDAFDDALRDGRRRRSTPRKRPHSRAAPAPRTPRSSTTTSATWARTTGSTSPTSAIGATPPWTGRRSPSSVQYCNGIEPRPTTTPSRTGTGQRSTAATPAATSSRSRRTVSRRRNGSGRSPRTRPRRSS